MEGEPAVFEGGLQAPGVVAAVGEAPEAAAVPAVEGGQLGRGETVADALAQLQATAPGDVVLATAQQLVVQERCLSALPELIRLNVMPAEKAALEMMGIEMGDCLKPFPSLTAGQKEELRKVLVENGCVLA